MPKIKAVDLLNKFNLLDNKIDIINTSLNLKKYIVNDFFSYIELKNYIKGTFCELKNEVIYHIKSDIEDQNQDESKKEIVSKISSIFSEYIEYIFVILDEKVKTFYNGHNNEIDNNMCIYESVKTIENKINNIYFENEIIKHQLQLGERLYNLEDSLNNLQKIIKNKIDEIDEIKSNVI